MALPKNLKPTKVNLDDFIGPQESVPYDEPSTVTSSSTGSGEAKPDAGKESTGAKYLKMINESRYFDSESKSGTKTETKFNPEGNEKGKTVMYILVLIMVGFIVFYVARRQRKNQTAAIERMETGEYSTLDRFLSSDFTRNIFTGIEVATYIGLLIGIFFLVKKLTKEADGIVED